MDEMIRSAAEMDEVYRKRAEKGLINEPYIIDCEQDGQRLIFFGSIHTTDAEHAEWKEFNKEWEKFVSSPRNKVVIYEGRLDDYQAFSEDDATVKYGETGKVVWRAEQAKVPAISGSDRIGELKYLKEKFSEAEVLAYIFGRQMHQWIRQDSKENPDWQSYAENALAQMNSLRSGEKPLWDEPLSLERAIASYEKVAGKDFNPHDEQGLYDISAPNPGSVSEEAGRFQDEFLMKCVRENWRAEKNVFVVFGSGHAIRLEPALKAITGIDGKTT